MMVSCRFQLLSTMMAYTVQIQVLSLRYHICVLINVFLQVPWAHMHFSTWLDYTRCLQQPNFYYPHHIFQAYRSIIRCIRQRQRLSRKTLWVTHQTVLEQSM